MVSRSFSKIYDHILNGNKNYGTDTTDIIRSALNCEPEMIQKNVIIAPAWKPDLSENHVDSITQIFDGIHKIWNLSLGTEKVTYILTGIGAPNVIEPVLAFGVLHVKKLFLLDLSEDWTKILKLEILLFPNTQYVVMGRADI